MDRKSIAIVAACFLLILLWTPLVHHFYPGSASPTNSVETATSPATTTNTSNAPAAATTAAITNLPVAGTNAGSHFVVHNDIPEQLLVVTNDNARYTFTSRGGGLKQVELLKYPETVSTVRRKNQVTNDLATLNTPAGPPVFALLGDDALQGDGDYKLTPVASGMVAEKLLPNGVVTTKNFHFDGNYLVSVTVTFSNTTKGQVMLPEQQFASGVATPMNPRDSGFYETILWYNGAKLNSVVTSYFDPSTTRMFGFFPRTPMSEYVGGTNNVNWVSAQNQFFILATMPKMPAETLVVHSLDLPVPTADELKENPGAYRFPKGLQTALTYPPHILLAGQSFTNQFLVFAGPKEYQTLASLGAKLNNEIDLVMNFGWVSAVSKVLLLAMNWLHHALSLPYGLTIILITVIIKALFWPLTAASTRSAKRMQALQPQLKLLQEKYKDEPQKLTQKQWEFYKKNKINPISGCLPMLLQIPVFFGFYSMLRTAIELRGAPFLWMGDLSKPDTILSLMLPLHHVGLVDMYCPINPMPLIMGATLLWQASLTPVSPGMDPSQQKMMKYMPLIMLFFMYVQPSGLALYYTVNNLLTIVQTKLTRMNTADVTAESAKTVVTVAPPKKKK